jgi:AGZA family xanthine/uracil permease-like MFS transporter
MAASFARIDFEDLKEAVPAFVTIVMMVFTYNIANGLTAGLLVYPLVKAVAGRFREVRGGALVLAGFCAAYYLFGMVH